jgi:hypothetical protein
MNQHDQIQHVRKGTDYQAPLRAINTTIEGLVHCGLIVRESEHGVLLTPEARAYDAIGVQVERELKNRAEMIRALADRLNVVEAELRAAREVLTQKGWVFDGTADVEPGVMPEQRKQAVLSMPSVAG